jgi:hypothetical protein
MMVGSALALIGNSSATGFQTGTVSYQEGYYHGTEFLGAGSQTINVTTLSGVPVTTLSGTASKATLPLGQYYFIVSPKAVLAGSNYVIANGTRQLVNVTAGTTSIKLVDQAYLTSQETFNFPGIVSGTSATVKFVTPQGFVFQTNTTSRNATAMVPNSGSFVVDATYGGTVFTFPQVYSNKAVNLSFSRGLQASGFVYNATTGNSISSFNVILINSTAKTYQNIAFTGGYFALSNLTNNTDAYKYNYMVVDAPGYAGVQYSLPITGVLPLTVNLSSGSSNVYSNYTLGTNPQYLNLSLKYVISNATALPFFGNSSIGSFYWQHIFDSNAITDTSLQSYAQNVTPSVSNYTITIDGYNYYKTGVGKATVSPSTISNTTTFNVTVMYKNSTIKATDLTSGFTVNLYAIGTQYTMGALKYSYQFAYNLSTVALASPTSVVTSFKSPVNITPQASNGYLNLKFTPSVKPTVVASEISLYWNGMVSRNYIVNSSLSNTTFVVPAGVNVYYNVSSAYYNPVTGQHDYQSATFRWYNGTKLMYTGYNASLDQFNTSGIHKIMLNYTSGSGASNTTNFSVIAITSSQTPSISLNVTSSGKVNFAARDISSKASMYVPQSKTVKFSGFDSYLNQSGYSVPLTFTWYFATIGSYTGYKTLGQNITQTFNTPSSTQLNSLGGPVTGYLNVTSVAGTYSNISLSVTVNDTTSPSPVMTLYNATGVSETNPVAGQVTTFSANSSTDPYYKETSLSYNWSVVYANGTKVTPGSSTYVVMGGNMTNSSYVKVQFNTVSGLTMSLNATNPSGVNGTSSRALTMTIATPMIIVQGAYLSTTPDQGSTVTAHVNVSNNGTVNAGSYTISLYVNGKLVTSHSYTNLPVGTTKSVDFNFSSPASGSVTFVFKATNSTEPSFFANTSAYTFTHSVNPPAYKTPLIIVGVIAVIIVISFAYYRLTSGGSKKTKTTQPATQPKQQPAKKDEKKK